MGRASALLNLLVGLFPFALAVPVVFAAALGPTGALIAALVAGLASIICMLVAKLPAYRVGRWFTFGPAELPKRSGPWWWTSWACLGVAVLMAMMSAAMLRI